MRLNRNISFLSQQLLPTFDYTITVLNKLKSRDTVSRMDVWYAKEIDYCDFTNTIVRNAQGNTVSVGGVYKALIPKQDNYLPYAKWKEVPDNSITFSEGDFIIKGKLNDDEIVTPNTIQQIVANHKPEAFQIKTFTDCTGTVELAEHYEVEGV